jgi:4'-phosphopantetheinyl transferase
MLDETRCHSWVSSLHLRWDIPPFNVQLQEHEVHIWKASLETSNSVIQKLEHVLSKDEATYASRFHFEKDRRYCIVARGMLRMLLSYYLNSDPSQLRFSSNSYGKPFLTFPSLNPRLHFNLSHSRDLALYVFSYARQVGIDVEYKRAEIDIDSLARISFSSNEQAFLRSLPDNLKCDAFFNCWTRKEAYIKALGEGLSVPSPSYVDTFQPGEPTALFEDREDPRGIICLSLNGISTGDRYAGALAVEGTEWRLNCWVCDE